MRLHTHECRWFFDGPPPDGVVDWFRQAAPWEQRPGAAPPEWPAQWREDRYVSLPGRDDLGIKSRVEPVHGEGVWARVELKGRTSEHGPVELATGVEGMTERWVKWSYGAHDVPPALGDVFQGPGVRAVRKKRLLRRALLPHGELAFELSDDALPPYRGFSAEVTRLELDGADFWTLGLEAHPWDEGIHVDFVVAAASLFESYPGAPALSLDHSWSYPGWLLRQPTA